MTLLKTLAVMAGMTVMGGGVAYAGQARAVESSTASADGPRAGLEDAATVQADGKVRMCRTVPSLNGIPAIPLCVTFPDVHAVGR